MANENNIQTQEQFIEPIQVKMQYGAPELKKAYKKFISRGLIIAVLIHAFLISLYIFSIYMEKLSAEKREQISRTIDIKDLDTPPSATENEQAPPKEIEVPEKIASIKDLQALIPEPVAREKAEEQTIKSMKELEKIEETKKIGREDVEGRELKLGEKTVSTEKIEEKLEKKEEKKVEKQKTYQQFEVEKAPVAVNLSSVQGSMRYPEIARSSGIEGRVTVKVLVGPDGEVQKIGGISGPEVFHDEVSSKVMNLTFTPALQNGQPVRCWVSVPFSFTLKGKFKKEKEKEDNTEEVKEN